MTKDLARKLGLERYFLFLGYKSKVLNINGRDITWYDRARDKVLQGKIVDIDHEYIHVTDGSEYQVTFPKRVYN